MRKATIGDAPAIARIHVDTWKTTYRGIIPDEVLDGLQYDDRESQWRGFVERPFPGCHAFVAEVGRAAVGFASCGAAREHTDRYDAELFAIYVLQAHQRSGIGRGLFEACVRRLAEDGRRAMMLWVLESNPARRFYEALRGEVFAQKKAVFGDRPLVEVAYGWTITQVRD